MAIALVQHVEYDDIGVAPLSVTTTATGAGNLLVVPVESLQSAASVGIPTISDNASGGSNVYILAPNTFVTQNVFGNSLQGAIFYCPNAKSATVVTVTPAGDGSMLQGGIAVYEYSGTDPISPLQDSDSAGNGSSSTFSPPDLTVDATDVIVIGATTDGAIHAIDAPYTDQFIVEAGSGGIPIAWADYYPSASGAGAVLHKDDTNYYVVQAAGFKQAPTSVSAKVKASTNLVF